MFGNVRVNFGQVLENLWKSSESGRKSSENRQKRRHQYVYNKRNIARQLKDMNFIFSWQEQYLTRWLRSPVRYCSCHSNIKIHIFSPTRNILYIFVLVVCILTCPTGSSKYGTTRKNIQQNYTPNHLISYMYNTTATTATIS